MKLSKFLFLLFLFVSLCSGFKNISAMDAEVSVEPADVDEDIHRKRDHSEISLTVDSGAAGVEGSSEDRDEIGAQDEHFVPSAKRQCLSRRAGLSKRGKSRRDTSMEIRELVAAIRENSEVQKTYLQHQKDLEASKVEVGFDGLIEAVGKIGEEESHVSSTVADVVQPPAPELPYNPDDYKKAKEGDKNLVGVNLKGADLSGLDLSGADLTDADLTGAHCENAKFNKAKMIRTKCIGAHFDDAELNELDVTDANFSCAKFFRAKLNKAKFVNTKFISSEIFFSEMNESEFVQADLSRAGILHTDVKNIKMVGGTKMVRAKLSELYFYQVQIEDVDCSFIKISKSTFKDCKPIKNVSFAGKETFLENVMMHNTSLENVSFRDAILTSFGIECTGKIGKDIDFSEARLTKCCFVGIRSENDRPEEIRILDAVKCDVLTDRVASMHRGFMKAGAFGCKLLSYVNPLTGPFRIMHDCGYQLSDHSDDFGLKMLEGVAVFHDEMLKRLKEAPKVITKESEIWNCGSFIESAKFDHAFIVDSYFSYLVFKNCSGLELVADAHKTILECVVKINSSLKLKTSCGFLGKLQDLRKEAK
jgi:uncharacterized protein YjbI with pentapeptide repeats